MVRRQRRRAYTLMEVVLVMALMIIFTAIGYPAIDSMYAGVKVEGASDDIRAAWADAQAHAVNEGRPYRFSVVPGKGNFRVAPDSGDFWSGGNAPTPDDPENPPLVLEKALPKGIVFLNNGGSAPGPDEDTVLPDGSVDPGQWVTTAVFLPDGTAMDDAEIELRMPGVRPYFVRLRALTGVVTVQRGEE